MEFKHHSKRFGILPPGLLVLLLELPGQSWVGCAAPTTNAQPASLPVPGHGTIQWSQPPGWFYTPPAIDPAGKAAFDFRLQGPGGRPTVLVTVKWDGFGTNKLKPTLDQLEGELRQVAKDEFVNRSVEKVVTVRRFESPLLGLRHATFTDAAFPGKPVPAGESRHATLGTFRTGTLWGRFMLMTNDADGDEFKSSLQIIESLRAAP